MDFKSALYVIWKYPPIILTPMYSYWTIGPVQNEFNTEGICYLTYKGRKLIISFKHIWMNVFITTIGCSVNYYIFYAIMDLSLSEQDFIRFYNRGIIFTMYIYHRDNWIFLAFLILLFLSIFLIVLIQFIDRYSKTLCCNCFESNCLPMTKITILDVDNPHQLQEYLPKKYPNRYITIKFSDEYIYNLHKNGVEL